MKQRKILDISEDHSVSIEIKGDVGLLRFVDERDCAVELTMQDLKDLRDWLTNEVIKDQIVGGKLLGHAENPVIASQTDSKNVQPVAGPLAVDSSVAKTQTKDTPLENRRAVTGTSPHMVTGLPQISRADGMELINLTPNIAKARDAFSPQNLNKPEA